MFSTARRYHRGKWSTVNRLSLSAGVRNFLLSGSLNSDETLGRNELNWIVLFYSCTVTLWLQDQSWVSSPTVWIVWGSALIWFPIRYQLSSAYFSDDPSFAPIWKRFWENLEALLCHSGLHSCVSYEPHQAGTSPEEGRLHSRLHPAGHTGHCSALSTFPDYTYRILPE